MPDLTANLPFPVAGVDVAGETARPAPLTAPDALNVRGTDPRTLRVRGASRAGLTRLVPDTVSGYAGFPVQHLNVVVDPTVEATLADFEAWGPSDGTPDPSTNNAAGGDTTSPKARNRGRYVRRGGSGVQPVRSSAGRRVVYMRFMVMYRPQFG